MEWCLLESIVSAWKLRRKKIQARISVDWPQCDTTKYHPGVLTVMSATPDAYFLEAHLFCGVGAARYSANAVSKLVLIQGERRYSLPCHLTQNTHIRCVTGHWSGVCDDAERCRRCLVNNSPRLLPERYFPASLSSSCFFLKIKLMLWSKKYFFDSKNMQFSGWPNWYFV